jgi:hypothetical protein
MHERRPIRRTVRERKGPSVEIEADVNASELNETIQWGILIFELDVLAIWGVIRLTVDSNSNVAVTILG